MKTYDIVLKTVEQADERFRKGEIITAHQIFDALSEDELRQENPVNPDHVQHFFQSRDQFSAEEIPTELIGVDGSKRIKKINVEKEVAEIPKNYDVALAFAGGDRMQEARQLMGHLTEKGLATEPLDKQVFKEFEMVQTEDVLEQSRGDRKRLDCRYCGDEFSSTYKFRQHLITRHNDQANWQRGEEVYVGIYKILSETYDGPSEVQERFKNSSHRGAEEWRYFASHPRRFLKEYGLPEMRRAGPKRELQIAFGFGATSGFSRADVVFMNLTAGRAVIVENKSTMDKGAFGQVQKYAGLMQDDYPFLDFPKTVVNFHSRQLSMGSGKKKCRTHVEGVRGEYVVDEPVHLIGADPDLTVFDLPEPLQRYLKVSQHLKT